MYRTSISAAIASLTPNVIRDSRIAPRGGFRLAARVRDPGIEPSLRSHLPRGIPTRNRNRLLAARSPHSSLLSRRAGGISNRPVVSTSSIHHRSWYLLAHSVFLVLLARS